MNVFECIETRRSTRKFSDTPVEKEKIEKIVEAGRFAPCGGNNQTTHFIVVTNKEVMEKMAVIAKEEFAKMKTFDGMYKSLVNSINASKKGNYVFHYNAPLFIILANKIGYGNAMADCCCSVENIMLEANELDLGSCYINQIHWLDENERMREYLYSIGLKEDETVCCCVSIGYSPVLNRNKAKRTGNPVTYVE